ncbi:uncharacterized protein SETTUDRAFT_32706 [Exserohilum turcica Et28A]|uniref:Uncharacterized protein n=1 Tax=Exserohilum turcicum (strain 28A) TaxID=671987 RepID=R0KB87_EXST2|nr:uncharacterized protein SETTUDRAFT_32706 [Exserohilum turcica Et28A]EOA85507.1 hypothetical protein SETTUDRAFT_32706 [Exserohilum turcica Et28A]
MAHQSSRPPAHAQCHGSMSLHAMLALHTTRAAAAMCIHGLCRLSVCPSVTVALANVMAHVHVGWQAVWLARAPVASTHACAVGRAVGVWLVPCPALPCPILPYTLYTPTLLYIHIHARSHPSQPSPALELPPASISPAASPSPSPSPGSWSAPARAHLVSSRLAHLLLPASVAHASPPPPPPLPSPTPLALALVLCRPSHTTLAPPPKPASQRR